MLRNKTHKLFGLFFLLTLSLAHSDTEQWLVATEATYAPFEFRDEVGKVVGFDVDLINAIAADQGAKAVVLPQSWTGIFDTLENGTRDIIAAGLTSTQERREKYAMSVPYATFSKLVVYTDEALDIQSPGDLSDLKITFLENSTFGNDMAQFTSSDNLLPRKTQFWAFADIINGKAHGTAGLEGVMLYYTKQYSTADRKFYTFAYEDGFEIALALKKDNHTLLKKVNDGLRNIRANGTYEKIYKKWFGQ